MNKQADNVGLNIELSCRSVIVVVRDEVPP